MNYQSSLAWLGLIGLCLTLLGCQHPGSLELVWSVRQGLVGQWGIRGDEVFTVGRYLGVYDLSTGRELRRVRLPQDYANITLGQIGPEVAVSDSALVFGWHDLETEGKVLHFDPKTLALRWERTFPWRWDVRETRTTFSVVADGLYLYALAFDKEGENLFKLMSTNGQTVWSRAIEKYIKGVPLVLHDGKLLIRSRVSPFPGERYGYYQAINPETGEILWRVRIDGTSVVNDDQPVISGDKAYVTSRAPPETIHFYTIDLRRGTVLDHQVMHQLDKPFVEHQGILHFGGDTPAAFDVERKQILWQAYLKSPQGVGLNVVARGVLDPAREEIYLGDWERDLYVLSSKTGDVKEKVYIGGHWRGEFLSPLKAFFGSYGVERLEFVRGLLFVGTVDKSLFVFRRTEKK